MSTKAYYQNQIDSLKRDIARLRSEITSKNERIKDLQKQKTAKREYYQSMIAKASDSNSKKSYRESLQTYLKNLDNDIASVRNQISSIKSNIESKQQQLKSAQESKKRASK